MDLQSLSNLFATTYNPDPNVRKAAELQIRKVDYDPDSHIRLSLLTC
jgi:hypothetical protein